MTESPEMQVQLVSSHGMLAILEVLEARCSRDVIIKLLQMINLVSGLCIDTVMRLSDFCLSFSLSLRILDFWRVSV